jgi:hypothetical protein
MLIFDKVGRVLARYLTASHENRAPVSPPTSPQSLLASLRPADVLLVEGKARISSAIKYLTQSTWSHAALYVGLNDGGGPGAACFVEADLTEGVRRVGVDAYAGLHTRICRPVGLSQAEREAVARFAIERIGDRYDLKNLADLARYLFPNPPVPTRWRRRLIALGSGDPSRAICSTLIAEAFQSIHYPILPEIERRPAGTPEHPDYYEEILAIRDHSLFAPRDFDVSPYFQIIKPTIESGFDFRTLKWTESVADAD